MEGLRVLDRAVTLAESCGRGLQLACIPTVVVDLLSLLQSDPEDEVVLLPVPSRETAATS